MVTKNIDKDSLLKSLDILGFIDRVKDQPIHKYHPEVTGLIDRIKGNLKRFNLALGKRYTAKTLLNPMRVIGELLKSVHHQTIKQSQATIDGDRVWLYTVEIILVKESINPKTYGVFYEDLNTPPVYTDSDFSKLTKWKGLYCRSLAEVTIAKALEDRGLPFLVNAGGRFFLNKKRVTRELDFIVFVGKGKSAILEVDGYSYHSSAAKDHTRDRIFRKLGLKVERFDAQSCIKAPDKVITEFLEIVQNF